MYTVIIGTSNYRCYDHQRTDPLVLMGYKTIEELSYRGENERPASYYASNQGSQLCLGVRFSLNLWKLLLLVQMSLRDMI